MDDVLDDVSRRQLLAGAGGFGVGLLGGFAVSEVLDSGPETASRLPVPSPEPPLRDDPAPLTLEEGTTRVPTGTYRWSSGGLEVDQDAALVGAGAPGSVVFSLTGGTMKGEISGTVRNIVVRGSNFESKAGLDLRPGASVDGFVWPEGGQEPEDRTFYTPTGGDEPVTVTNSAWAWMSNNGAYTDKPPMQYRNCVAINNNVSQIRLGHRDGTPTDATSYVWNSLIGVTRSVETGENSPEGRGIWIHAPGNFVIENCWFVYHREAGATHPIQFDEEAAGSNVTIRNCAFYNETGNSLVSDRTDGDVSVSIENCIVQGPGSKSVPLGVDDSGLTRGSTAFPLPSTVTGYLVADRIEGVGPDVAPWAGT